MSWFTIFPHTLETVELELNPEYSEPLIGESVIAYRPS